MNTTITIALALLLTSTLSSAERIAISNWGANQLGDWERKSFTGETGYELIQDDGYAYVRAQSQATASGLFREIKIDLNKTPILNWRWRIREPLSGLNERSKNGDDYAARVYVIVDGGALFWRTKALNYVWSGSQPIGSKWPNAYTGSAKMLAIRGAQSSIGEWQQERRDVRADLKQIFGTEIDHIDAVAIMTDSDDSGGKASADYGEIWFSAE